MEGPTLDDVRGEFAGWHVWKGIAGLVYGRLLNSSPPVVVRAENALALRDQISQVEGSRDKYGRPQRAVIHG